MRVAAEDGHRPVRMFPHQGDECITDGFAGEVGQPVIVGDLTFVPAGFTEGRNVSQQQDVPAGGEHFSSSLSEIVGRFVAKGVEFPETGLFGETGEFVDALVVVETDVRAEEVAKADVCPRVMADESGIGNEGNDAGDGQPVE